MKLLNAEDNVTCELVNDPTNYHFSLYCEDCDLYFLSRDTLEKAEAKYRDGRINQAQYEAYMHVWAELSPHGGKPEWRTPPSDPDVIRMANKLKFFIRERK